MSPVVVVDDISSVVSTGDVDRVRYFAYCVLGVSKTHNSVFIVCCVGNVHREPQEGPYFTIIFIYGTEGMFE